MMEKLGNVKCITMLDVTKGYWQIPMSKQDQEKTVFLF